MSVCLTDTLQTKLVFFEPLRGCTCMQLYYNFYIVNFKFLICVSFI